MSDEIKEALHREAYIDSGEVHLYWADASGDEIETIPWPESFKEYMTVSDLRDAGYLVMAW